jgi:hypothetical protein
MVFIIKGFSFFKDIHQGRIVFIVQKENPATNFVRGKRSGSEACKPYDLHTKPKTRWFSGHIKSDCTHGPILPVKMTVFGHSYRLTFFYPDYTVGLGVSPGHALRWNFITALAGFTADRELVQMTL